MKTTLDVQSELQRRGYYKGALDNVAGTQTRYAIEQFQSANGLTRDGWVGPKTLAKLFPPAPTKTPVDFNTAAEQVIARQPVAARSIKEVIVHCTATPEGRDVSVDTIRSWHLKRGWQDIGYHYVVQRDGTVEAGRPEAEIGSHVAGHNTGTLGVTYVGGVEIDGKTPKDTRTALQKAALMDLVSALVAKYPSIKKVSGHNQYAEKACPSFDVRKDALSSIV